MNLDTRLAALRDAPQPAAAGAAAVRSRAAERGRRRLLAVSAATLATVAIAAGVAYGNLRDDPPDRDRADTVTAGPPDSSAPDSSPPDDDDPDVRPLTDRTVGSVEGVTVEVSPRTDLTDGQMVEVEVDGLESLPGALILLCAGDVDSSNASTSCDTAAVQDPVADVDVQVTAQHHRTVSVGRFIQIARDPTDPNASIGYDCATEPAGCVLAVAPFELPARGVLVPISFRDVPTPDPRLHVSPATGLTDGQDVTVEVHGGRANGGFTLSQCTATGHCDVVRWNRVRSDGDGTLTASLQVNAAIYSYEDGRTDCTASACTLSVTLPSGTVVASQPIQFAAGVSAPVPQLTIDRPGPFLDGQEVTLLGTGFPPGVDVSSQIGQCPAHLDTAVQERCQYPLAFTPTVVGSDGRFRATIRLSSSLLFTGACTTEPGCVVGWVIPHGPTVATTRLTFPD